MFFWGMTRIEEAAIANAILKAPGWAKVGISAPKEQLREDAARELARVILDCTDDSQLKLAL